MVDFSCEAIWSWALFAGRFLITVSISLLVMGLLRSSISSWFSFGKLYFSKNFPFLPSCPPIGIELLVVVSYDPLYFSVVWCDRTDFWTLWEKARVGCFERTALKHVYYLGWNRSPAQAGCMRQVLGPGALGRPRGMGLGGRWEGGSGWGTHVYPWLIHVNVWQKPLQYCKVISLQLIKK